MAAPDIALVKVWCRIDGDEFDSILPTMIDSAVALASHECGVDYKTAAMPDAVQQWCAAHVAYWLENKAAEGQPSPFLSRLLDPWRAYAWSENAA